jgi:hypothetical protein
MKRSHRDAKRRKAREHTQRQAERKRQAIAQLATLVTDEEVRTTARKRRKSQAVIRKQMEDQAMFDLGYIRSQTGWKRLSTKAPA